MGICEGVLWVKMFVILGNIVTPHCSAVSRVTDHTKKNRSMLTLIGTLTEAGCYNSSLGKFELCMFFQLPLFILRIVLRHLLCAWAHRLWAEPWDTAGDETFRIPNGEGHVARE